MWRGSCLFLLAAGVLSAQSVRFGVDGAALVPPGWDQVLRAPGIGLAVHGERAFGTYHGVRLRGEFGTFGTKESSFALPAAGGSLGERRTSKARGGEFTVEYVHHLQGDPHGWEFSAGLGFRAWRLETSLSRDESIVTGTGQSSFSTSYGADSDLNGLCVAAGVARGMSEHWAVFARLSLGLGSSEVGPTGPAPLTGMRRPVQPWEGKKELPILALGVRARF